MKKSGLHEKSVAGACLCEEETFLYQLLCFRGHWFRETANGKIEKIDDADRHFLNEAAAIL